MESNFLSFIEGFFEAICGGFIVVAFLVMILFGRKA
jgi:hypothetical protein